MEKASLRSGLGSTRQTGLRKSCYVIWLYILSLKVQVDASDYALGKVLMQEDNIVAYEKQIAIQTDSILCMMI